MYKDASRWSLAFQSYVQLTMAEVHRKQTVGSLIPVTSLYLTNQEPSDIHSSLLGLNN